MVGRPVSDRVTTLGGGVDGTVRRRETTYDSAGRAIQFTSFDAANQRTLMQDVSGQTAWTFDLAGRVKTETGPTGTRLTHTYDLLGQRKVMLDPTGRTTYSFDAANRIQWLINPLGERFTFAHDAAGRRTVDRLANGTRASFVYDNADRLTQLINRTAGGSVIASVDYLLDKIGNRLRVIDHAGNRTTWTHDASYQLRRERRTGANAYDITHTYDLAGNRLVQIDGGARTSWSYDAADQTAVEINPANRRTTFTFDGAGNQSVQDLGNSGRVTCIWDGENKLTGVRLQNGTRTTYVYDGDGRRVRKSGSATPNLFFVWDMQNILQEFDSGGGLDTSVAYTLEPQLYGKALSQSRGGSSHFFHFDGLGSTVALTNAAATVTDTNLYEAFGAIRASTGTTVYNFRFVGQLQYVQEATVGMYSVRARWYGPQWARWASEDPLQFAIIPMPDNAYVYNNPLINVDPSGADYVTGTMAPAGSDPEWYVCLRRFGWGPCYHAWTLRDPSYAETARRFPGTTNPHNNRADAFRHCFWSCKMKQILLTSAQPMQHLSQA